MKFEITKEYKHNFRIANASSKHGTENGIGIGRGFRKSEVDWAYSEDKSIQDYFGKYLCYHPFVPYWPGSKNGIGGFEFLSFPRSYQVLEGLLNGTGGYKIRLRYFK